MDIVLGVSMTPTTVRMVLVEGEKADGSSSTTMPSNHRRTMAQQRLRARPNRSSRPSSAPRRARPRAATT